jgi:DNA-binding response OmpR family regulator
MTSEEEALMNSDETPSVPIVTRDVLVVDDEADLVATYERLLRREGYRVASAGTRAAGLAAIQRDRPGLLIADLRLPDGDGLDVVRAARALPSPPHVIVVTGFGGEASRDAALSAGAAAFLTKPFSTAAFARLVRSILGPASC